MPTNSFIEYKDILWKPHQQMLVPHAPTHAEIFLTSKEAKDLLKIGKTKLIRYTSHFDHPEPTPFWYVIKDNPPSMEELSKNMRNQVRKGLRLCEVIPLTVQELINHNAYTVYKKAYKRYSTYLKPSNQQLFENHLKQIGSNYEFWGVLEKETKNLIAYSQNLLLQETCSYISIKSDPDYLKLYGNYALFYTMNDYYLKECKLRYVNDGARNISHHTNIQDLLIDKFKFRKAYCFLHLHYHPLIYLSVASLLPFHGLIKKLSHPFLDKLDALLTQKKIHRECIKQFK